MNNIDVTVIIPVLDEEDALSLRLPFFKNVKIGRNLEVIVVDGGSSDNSIAVAEENGTNVIQPPIANRATQMNIGEQHASGKVLWFVRADAMPPSDFNEEVELILNNKAKALTYRTLFHPTIKSLRSNEYLTRFPLLRFRGGDQTLMIKKDLFWEIGGFEKDYVIMEDYRIIQKLNRMNAFQVVQKDVIISSRKYKNHSYFKVNFANTVVFLLFLIGVDSLRLKKLYKRFLQ